LESETSGFVKPQENWWKPNEKHGKHGVREETYGLNEID
jgi:hypothetical protein